MHKAPDFHSVQRAAERLAGCVVNTPIVSSQTLNHWLGHQIFFKVECLQKTGAFKARGGLNTLKWLREQPQQPRRVVANSSGNHAQAVAWAAREVGIPATIYMPQNVSTVKAAATVAYGANIELLADRTLVDNAVAEAAQHPGTYWIPPFDHPEVIAGQGTAALEAFSELDAIDATFTPCGGGGLVSGTFLAARGCSKSAVFGVEPLEANDAAESLRSGHIQSLSGPPATIADGARTPSVSPLTFDFLKQLDGFYEASEDAIVYWTQWLQHLLKLHIEPTSAMAMVGVSQWLYTQSSPRTVLVILSGGNIDRDCMQRIWTKDRLSDPPSRPSPHP